MAKQLLKFRLSSGSSIYLRCKKYHPIFTASHKNDCMFRLLGQGIGTHFIESAAARIT